MSFKERLIHSMLFEIMLITIFTFVLKYITHQETGNFFESDCGCVEFYI